METPERNDKEPQPDAFLSTKYLGICRFTVEPVTGIYACGINDVNGGEDIQTYYKVEVYNTPAKAMTPQVEVKFGKPAKLLVKSIFNHPMAYCRFTNPNREVHGVSERFTMEGKYRYYGSGLISGECGIEILATTKDEVGIWSCTFSTEGQEYKVDMVISHSGKV